MAGTNSARGGLTNVDWERYDLRYQIAVYSSDGSRLLVAPQAKTSDTYGPTVFEFRLTPNNTYKFVAWADFVHRLLRGPALRHLGLHEHHHPGCPRRADQ